MITLLQSAHLLPLRRVVKEDKIAEHRREAQKTQSRDDHDDSVLEIELAGAAVDEQEELEPVGLDDGCRYYKSEMLP